MRAPSFASTLAPRSLALLLASASAVPALAAGGGGGGGGPQCTFKGDPTACFPYGCVPVDGAGKPFSSDADPDLIRHGTPGRCGPCTNDDQCSGGLCRKTGDGAGTCARYQGSPAPQPVRPRFGLVVADVSLNLADSADARPIVSVGYLGQISLSRARPAVREEGGFITPDPPRWYADGGVAAAFAGASQNLFVTAGVTYYLFQGPLGLTTVSGGALYQRQGGAIWELDTAQNRDRAGPSLTLGFLQNVYVRGAYVFGLAGPDEHGAAIVSLVYMRDLVDDLVSDRFTKYLPKALRPD